MSDPAKRGRANRAKGARGELEVAKMLQEYGWPYAERTSNGRHQAKGDIARGPGHAVIEVRSKRTYSVHTELDAVAELCDPVEFPILFTRRHGGDWTAHLPARELLSLLAARDGGRL